MWTPPERVKHALPEPGWPTAAEAAASRLYQPIALGPRTARHRTWVPAMVPWRATEDGLVTPEVLAWYRRLAEGRPGVLVVEATGIRDVPSGPLLRVGHERFVPGLGALARAVAEASGGETLLVLQIIDFLRVRRRPTREAYLGRFVATTSAHRAALGLAGDAPEADVRAALLAWPEARLAEVLAPRELEALERGERERVTDVHLPHVEELPRVLPPLFAAAARRALDAGFDGVELHFAHAYTMASFLSARNDRRDGYGGSLDGRLRLPLEVVAAVRAAVGVRGVLGCRFLGDEVIDGGTSPEDATAIGVRLAAAGLDYLSISAGGKFEDAAVPKIGRAVYPYTGPSGYACMPTVYSDARGPFGRNLAQARAVRAAVRAAGHACPIVAAGGLGTFAAAEAALAGGACDVVGAARQSLADPDWWRKVRLGRGAEVVRCGYTNYCEALDQRHEAVTCQKWDRKALDAPDVRLDATGRRRLVAPAWEPGC